MFGVEAELPGPDERQFDGRRVTPHANDQLHSTFYFLISHYMNASEHTISPPLPLPPTPRLYVIAEEGRDAGSTTTAVLRIRKHISST